MACFISIEGSIAYRPEASTTVSRIVAWGSVTDSSALTVKITIGTDQFEAAGQFPVAGGWVANIDVSSAGLTCGDVADIDLDVTSDADQGCAAHSKVSIVQCQVERGCPVFEKFSAAVVDASPAGCVDGERSVRIEAQLPNTPTGLGAIFTVFFIRPLEGGPEILLGTDTPEPGEEISATGLVPGGLYTYGLRILSPEPCEGPIGVIEVPACPTVPDDPALCPTVTHGTVTVSENCTPAQQRIVTATSTVTPEPGTPVSAQLVVMDGDTVVLVLDSADDVSTQTVLNGSGPVPPGNYTIGVEVTDPAACNFSGNSLRVPACSTPGDDPVTCPRVQLGDIDVSTTCNDDGERVVTASATLTPQQGTPATASLTIMDGDTVIATLDTGSSIAGQITLEGSASVPPGNYVVNVDVTAPDRCAGLNEAVTVPACPAPPQNGGDGGGPVPWCLLALIAALVILVVGALVTGIAFCVIGFLTNPVSITIGVIAIVIGLALLILGNILFIIWLLTCGSCRLSCIYLDWLLIVFTFLPLITLALAGIGAFLALMGWSALCWAGWLIDTIDLTLLLVLVVYWRKVVGCDTWPEGWPNWLRIRLPTFLTNLCGR